MVNKRVLFLNFKLIVQRAAVELTCIWYEGSTLDYLVHVWKALQKDTQALLYTKVP